VDAEGRVVEVEPLVDGIPALPDAVGLPPPSEVALLVMMPKHTVSTPQLACDTV
jgi:hypothetical protein